MMHKHTEGTETKIKLTGVRQCVLTHMEQQWASIL